MRRVGVDQRQTKLTTLHPLLRMIVMFVKTSIALLAASVLALSGCAAAPSDTSEADGKLQVAVAFYPFQFVAERIGGSQVAVTNLTPPGAEPHDLELAPQQVAGLAEADLVVIQSGFQPAVDNAVTQVTPKRTVDTATFLTFLNADAEEHSDADHAEEADHDHGAHDPHTWLDPTNLAVVAEHVRDALSEARPVASAEFNAKAEALVKDLATLDQDFKSGLAKCERSTFITSHAAFGYLAHRYDLTQVGIRGLEPDVEPSAARIAEVQQIARTEGVTTIFFETLVSPVVSQSIAGDLGLAVDVLDPLEGISADSRGNDYLEVMRANLAALRAANQCS